ncbi:Arabinogalactan peptide, AGP [Cynara cardunculus var. scolymus]|uniref:Arabinogalactan peptide, AGP n=1 Tax=Cynara cardunculus var. scolymus TaxID=59895 RepID=A0A103Y2C9_CYNCS|nr:Arabinogalactan peptide, AGP [Cynara cardunculus var. scolymus]
MKGVGKVFTVTVFVTLLCLIFPIIDAQGPASAPSPSSDGATIDQGVAYVLMVVALALTYIIH